MKKFLACVLCCLVLLAAPCAVPLYQSSAAGVTLTQDFESNFSVSSGLEFSTADAYSGSQSLHYTTSAAAYSKLFLTTDQNIQSGISYRVSYFVKIVTPPTTGKVAIRFAYLSQNASGYNAQAAAINTTIFATNAATDGWVQKTYEFTADRNAWLGLNVYTTATSSCECSVYIDQIVLTELVPTTISFVTNTAEPIASVSGDAGTQIGSLPTPTAPAGKVFGGWYTDSAFTNAFTDTVYPADDITLYAKWTVKGALTQDFESYDASGTVTAQYTYYTASGEGDANVHSGTHSLYRAVTSGTYAALAFPDSTEYTLRAGGEYVFTAWVKLVQITSTATLQIKYVSDKANVNAQVSGSTTPNACIFRKNVVNQAGELGTESIGQWVQITYAFTATHDGYLGISGWGSAEMYVDDITLTESYCGVTTAYNGSAAVRAADANTLQGIRIKSKIEKDWIENADIAEYGTLAIRTARLSGAELTGETANAVKGMAYHASTKPTPTLYSVTDTENIYTGVLIRINPKYYSETYTIRAYAIDTDGKAYYADAFEVSVFDVVQAIKNKADAPASDVAAADMIIAQAAEAHASNPNVITYEDWLAAK